MFSNVKRSVAARNIFWLYGLHATNILLPLITVPLLARVLRPSGWGLMAFAQGVAVYLTILVNFGFNASATREIARVRHLGERVAEVAAGVMGAKLMLAGFSLVIGVILQMTIPAFRPCPRLFFSAVAWGIFTGLHTLWYFQGIEDLKLMSIVDIASKGVAAGMIFLLVRSEDDGWIALALLAAGQCLASSIMLVRMYREVTFIMPTWGLSLRALTRGWHMFLFSLAQNATAAAGTLIVAAFAPASTVGFYSGAERLVRASTTSLGPVMQSLFSRLSYLAHHDLQAGRALIRRLMWILGGGSIAASVGLLIFAPSIIRIVLGHGYEPAVPILRLLALLPPMSVMAGLLGNLWAHPLGLDRPMSRAAIYASIVTVASGFSLVPRFHATGMAVSILLGHAVLLVAYYILLSRSHLLPFGAKRPAPPANGETESCVVARCAQTTCGLGTSSTTGRRTGVP